MRHSVLGEVSRGIPLFVGLFALSWLPCWTAEPAVEWAAQAQQNVSEFEYELRHTGNAWEAPNREHDFRITFAADGIQLVPRVQREAAWDWGLTLTGVGRPGFVAPVEAAKLQVAGARIEYDRGAIVEWYVNEPSGLEQGFTLALPPPAAQGFVVLDLALSGSLQPRFVDDHQTVELIDARGETVLHYTDLSVFDADGMELPAQMEPVEGPHGQGIRLRFDDTAARYPVTVDPYVKSPTWNVTSGQPGSWFGYSVSTAGDVNGDGYSDVIVGAPAFDNGENDEGRAYLYLGTPSGVSTTPAWTTESDSAGALYGWSVATAGDVNGDGYDDVLVGASNYTNVEFLQGKAYLYYGSAAGLETTAGWTREGNVGSGYFGTSVATAGDVNRDGYADVLVSAPWEGNGKVYLFLGSAAGLATTAVWTAVSDQASSGFGEGLATAGDVNGDGYADIVIGAEVYDGPEFNGGRAYVYLGEPGGLATAPVWFVDSQQAGAELGSSVATAGDVNGDGYSDVIVGAPNFDNGENNEGKAYVYCGNASGVSASPAWTLEGNDVGAHFGISVGTAGDGNGDGYADIIVGADRFFGGEGRVTVYFGSANGPATEAGYTRYGGTVGTYLGISVGTAGDVDGDGFSDLITGSYGFNALNGRATVDRFAGSESPNTQPVWTGEGDQVSSRYGVSVASAGDVNGDGYSDVLVGSDLYDDGEADEGRAYLYLGWEFGLSSSPSWTVEGNRVVGQLGNSVSSAGDVNGDGYSDVVVGSAGGFDGGRVLVYHGSPTGLSTAENWLAQGSTSSFGTSVASAGDVNGDGYSDLIVGSPHQAVDQPLEGAAFVYLGSATGLGSVPAWSAQGYQSGSRFGYSVASAGDVNGDGYSDVIVGAPGFTNAEVEEGRAFLYLGSATGLAKDPVWSRGSSIVDAFFGISVASAGDVNGDGYSDWLVAAPNVGVNDPGCMLFLGSSSNLAAPDSYSLGACYNVAPAGDTDNDGYSDFLTWWPNAVLHRGSSLGFLSTNLFPIPGNPYVLGIGSPIGSAGDVNGDGFSDLILGVNKYSFDQNEEGGAFVFLGGGNLGVPGPRRHRMPRQMQSDGVTPISLLGKSDSENGFRLLAPGYSAAGRADIRLRWEAKPYGTPFDNSGLGGSAVIDTGPVGVNGSMVSFDEQVSGLGLGTAYRWRARTESTNPFFPRAPWMTATGIAHTEKKLIMSGCFDLDGDGFGSPVDASCLSLTPDCNDADVAVWATPSETTDLRFTADKTTLDWDAPSTLGAPPSTIVYDTIRATIPNGFLGGNCVESDDGSDTTAIDLDLPGPGEVFFYLTRAQNACPIGAGSIGTNSVGEPRTARTCP